MLSLFRLKLNHKSIHSCYTCNNQAITMFLKILLLAIHTFYVSITHIEYNASNDSIEVSMKLFTDDLEEALEERTAQRLYLNTDKEIKKTDQYLQTYIQQHLSIQVDEKDIEIQFLGKEYEDDATWCYLEIKNIGGKFKKLSVQNSILTDTYDGQANLVHCSLEGKKKSLLFRKGSESKNAIF